MLLECQLQAGDLSSALVRHRFTLLKRHLHHPHCPQCGTWQVRMFIDGAFNERRAPRDAIPFNRTRKSSSQRQSLSILSFWLPPGLPFTCMRKIGGVDHTPPTRTHGASARRRFGSKRNLAMRKFFSPKLDSSWYEARTLFSSVLSRAGASPILVADVQEGLLSRSLERQRQREELRRVSQDHTSERKRS